MKKNAIFPGFRALLAKVLPSIALICCIQMFPSIQAVAQKEQESQLEADITKLDILRSSNNLDAMRIQIDTDSEKWRNRDPGDFLFYMYRACGELSSYSIGDLSQRALLLSRYSISVLRSGDLPLPQYVQFVEFLRLDPPDIDEIAWKTLRKQKTEFWLKAVRQIDRAINPSFDFEDRPVLNVNPPVGAGLPAGVSPASIRNPQLRAEYESAIKQNNLKTQKYNEQSWLKLNGTRVHDEAERYLVNAYAKPPLDLAEIKLMLAEYVDDPAVRERLIKEIQKAREH